ncbi:alanine racemase [Clostridioides difficile]|uniref:alanine racemase n=1 Tax=Clostridioides difficile TaxID=1496 RepID=UPI001033E033|nr:alanine racemase [Clostridioides difficile]MCV2271268.1 alanine racemase [Clostridioides difficile]MDI3116169.1 alanine racemase [Clostridioides difficile]MDV9710116.1 alanine racemase [Clostridioides difficile]MDW0090441.1 alanine racemase [Clostridioides difficile]HBE9108773.1 alanine racemase [Clostridioides difficile]
MFLKQTLKDNKKLVDYSIKLHKEGKILPDTYVIDMDMLIQNASKIYEKANEYGIKLYQMTKQIGRNPYIATKLQEIGYEGVVAVDIKEALIMHRNGIKVSHVGHLVQTPKYILKKLIKDVRPEVITIFSLEKAIQINDVCQELNTTQKILIRFTEEEDTIYPLQYGGFKIDNIKEIIIALLKLEYIEIEGLTSFPCFLFDSKNQSIIETNNITTIKNAKQIIETQFNIKINQMNMPSLTSVYNMDLIYKHGGTHGEPGHALTGSTPLHSIKNLEEKLCMLYVSEISHNLKNTSYVYGGGHYRRSHMENALIVDDVYNEHIVETLYNNPENIDYYFEVKGNHQVGATVIMNFRTQVFVTRSDVAIVSGISKNTPRLEAIYDSLGRKKELLY